jgi:hypothetical protein
LPKLKKPSPDMDSVELSMAKAFTTTWTGGEAGPTRH